MERRVLAMPTSEEKLFRTVARGPHQADRLANDGLDREDEPVPLAAVRTVHHLQLRDVQFLRVISAQEDAPRRPAARLDETGAAILERPIPNDLGQLDQV